MSSPSLPEFQRKLSEALEHAQEALDDFVGVWLPTPEGWLEDNSFSEMSKEEVSVQRWLIDAGDLSSTGQIFDRAWVGGLAPWAIGIAQLQGKVLNLVDMPRFMGSQKSIQLPAWATLLHERFESPWALVWPHLFGMVPRQDLKLLERKPHHPWIRRYWKDADGLMWYELSVEQWLLSPVLSRLWDETGDKEKI